MSEIYQIPENSGSVYAVIPAAGQSLRMGNQHKLLLPWLSGSSVMESVLRAWLESRVDRIVIVARADDDDLLSVLDRGDVDIVLAEQPPAEMKHSIQLGLHYLAKHYSPTAQDRWMVAPADLPTLTTELIDQVIVAACEIDCIYGPVFVQSDLKSDVVGSASKSERSLKTKRSPNSKRSTGHPINFPWTLAEQVHRLGVDEGLDALVRHHPVHWIERPWSEKPRDIDTPEEYQQRLSEARQRD